MQQTLTNSKKKHEVLSNETASAQLLDFLGKMAGPKKNWRLSIFQAISNLSIEY